MFGEKFDLLLPHGPQRIGGVFFHVHEPLQGQARLYDRSGALAAPHAGAVIFGADQCSQSIQFLRDQFACSGPVLAHKKLRGGTHGPVRIQHVDGVQVMPLPEVVIVHIVRGGHFEATRSEFHVHIIVENDGDRAVDERHDGAFPLEVGVARVVGVYRNGRIAENGFGPDGGDGDVLVAVLDAVAHMVERTVFVAINNLFVAENGLRLGVPVGHAQPPVDLTAFVQIDEDFDHGPAQRIFHREAGALPVAARAEFFELLQNDAAVLVLPFKGLRQKFFAAQVRFFNAPLAQPLHDFGLRSNTRMIGTGHPAGIFALQPRPPDQNVLNGAVEHMSHVQHPGHVGRRNDDAVRLALVGFAVEVIFLHPVGVPAGFGIGGVVGFC